MVNSLTVHMCTVISKGFVGTVVVYIRAGRK